MKEKLNKETSITLTERYSIRWRNGAWKIFDNKEYTDVECFGSFVELQNFLER